MNRIERKTESIERISQVLGECRVCRIAVNDENAPYIVPLSYGYELVSDKLFLYFHCAQKGKKILLLKKCPSAGFETDTMHQLVTAQKACGYTAKYSSVAGWGNVEFVENDDEKMKALCLIMHHYTGVSQWDISKAALDEVCILKLNVCEYSCKENL